MWLAFPSFPRVNQGRMKRGIPCHRGKPGRKCILSPISRASSSSRDRERKRERERESLLSNQEESEMITRSRVPTTSSNDFSIVGALNLSSLCPRLRVFSFFLLSFFFFSNHFVSRGRASFEQKPAIRCTKII